MVVSPFTLKRCASTQYRERIFVFWFKVRVELEVDVVVCVRRMDLSIFLIGQSGWLLLPERVVSSIVTVPMISLS